jgi:hypothetical protein
MHVEDGNPVWRQPDIPVASGTLRDIEFGGLIKRGVVF